MISSIVIIFLFSSDFPFVFRYGSLSLFSIQNALASKSTRIWNITPRSLSQFSCVPSASQWMLTALALPLQGYLFHLAGVPFVRTFSSKKCLSWRKSLLSSLLNFGPSTNSQQLSSDRSSKMLSVISGIWYAAMYMIPAFFTVLLGTFKINRLPLLIRTTSWR